MSAPKFDFNWQVYYENAEPVCLPAGMYNPAPDKEVLWSEQSWDEMFSPFLQFTKDAKP